MKAGLILYITVLMVASFGSEAHVDFMPMKDLYKDQVWEGVLRIVHPAHIQAEVVKL